MQDGKEIGEARRTPPNDKSATRTTRSAIEKCNGLAGDASRPHCVAAAKTQFGKILTRTHRRIEANFVEALVRPRTCLPNVLSVPPLSVRSAIDSLCLFHMDKHEHTDPVGVRPAGSV